MYERAREHQADRESRSEDSHQIKHWILDHQELLAPPRFNFKIIKTFQDPLSRQLSEAIRIELRGESVLNSKSEFNRCKIPRLTINLDEWKSRKEKEKEEEGRSHRAEPGKEEDHQEPSDQWEDDGWLLEAEESLSMMDMKRKMDNQPSKRKSKRLKLERLVCWGEQTSLLEDIGDKKETSSQEENRM